MQYQQHSLLHLFQKHYGLFQLETKIPIRDNYALSLVYTPGVGQSCLEIQKNQELGLIYTNKANQVMILTDSSGFYDFDFENWNNYVPIPYLECLSIYYKTQCNVDAFPLVLDFNLIKNADDLIEMIVTLSPAYSGFELYKISEDRARVFCQKVKKMKDFPNVVLITTIELHQIEYKIANLSFKQLIDPKMIVGALFRAALDTRSYGLIPIDCITYVLDTLKSIEDESGIQDYYFMVHSAVTSAAEYFISRGFATNKDVTLENIVNTFDMFLIEGKKALFQQLPDDFDSTKLSTNDNSLILHKRFRGMIESAPKIQVKDPRCLDQLFSLEQISKIAEIIKKDPAKAWDITCKRNLSAIITNGTAVLGFGDIGALEGLPVMEGKSCLFKQLGGVDLVPLCITEKNPEKVRDFIKKICPIFSAINLEDIKAPECFEIERPLIETLGFPIFHDDQHGTAIVTVAGMLNSVKLLKKTPADLKTVINGGGAAGQSICELLLETGVKDIIVCDTKGAIYEGRPVNMNKYKNEMAAITNKNQLKGNLEDIIKGSDFFVGVSVPKTLTQQMIKTMNPNPIVFALSNPTPEIYPHEALEAGALIVATGRSDFPNQVNNSLAFPGIFRAFLDTKVPKVTIQMKAAAAKAIADLIPEEDLSVNYIIPNALDSRVPIAVAKAVAKVAIEQKLNKRDINPNLVEDDMRNFLVEGHLRSLINQQAEEEYQILKNKQMMKQKIFKQ